MRTSVRHIAKMHWRIPLSAWLLTLSLAISEPALSAIGFDRATSTTGNTASLSWSHTVGVGTNRILVVGVSIRRSNRTVTGVTYGSQTLTQLGVQISGGNTSRLEVWYLLAPLQGTALVTVNLSSATDVIGGAVSYFGVDQLAPLGTFTSVGGTGTGASLTVGSAPAEEVVGVIAAPGNAQSLTPDAGQNVNWNTGTGTGGANERGAGGRAAGAGSVTISWTLGASADWAVGAIPLRPTPNPNIVLTLSQSNSNPSPGTEVVYTIGYQNTGEGQAGSTLVTLSIPLNTAHVANSVLLNGVAKTDAPDADEVTLSGSTITVNLGGVPTGGSGTITYRVIVQ